MCLRLFLVYKTVSWGPNSLKNYNVALCPRNAGNSALGCFSVNSLINELLENTTAITIMFAN